jgi:hypothetical protein
LMPRPSTTAGTSSRCVSFTVATQVQEWEEPVTVAKVQGRVEGSQRRTHRASRLFNP